MIDHYNNKYKSQLQGDEIACIGCTFKKVGDKIVNLHTQSFVDFWLGDIPERIQRNTIYKSVDDVVSKGCVMVLVEDVEVKGKTTYVTLNDSKHDFQYIKKGHRLLECKNWEKFDFPFKKKEVYILQIEKRRDFAFPEGFRIRNFKKL